MWLDAIRASIPPGNFDSLSTNSPVVTIDKDLVVGIPRK